MARALLRMLCADVGSQILVQLGQVAHSECEAHNQIASRAVSKMTPSLHLKKERDQMPTLSLEGLNV